MRDLVVGFDLDMTLVDSADGIVDTVLHVCARHGVAADPNAVRAGIGLPLDRVLPGLLPDVPFEQALAQYRARYLSHAVPATVPLPGAAESVAAVRRAGGRVLVVTAKKAEHARACLEVAGLEVDEVVGGRFAEAKGAVLADRGVFAYVGDHPGDVAAAEVAGAVSVAVATGPTPSADLRAAGADVLLGSLTQFPGWLPGAVLAGRLDTVRRRLVDLGSVLVALSGGVDSALVLAAATRALPPDRVVAATAVSPSLPDGHLAAAAALADDLGVRHVTVPTDEMGLPGYRANGPDRCAHCRAALMAVLGPVARSRDLAAVVTGTNAEDLRAGDRPGIEVAARAGAVSPLAEAGLTKDEVRRAARDWGLAAWDRPQSACLSSRVAHGIAITPQRLARVDAAEVALRAALVRAGVGVRDMRVRDLGDRARVEVDAVAVAAVAGCPEALAAVRSAGFTRVEVDPRGFRSGSMNLLWRRSRGG